MRIIFKLIIIFLLSFSFFSSGLAQLSSQLSAIDKFVKAGTLHQSQLIPDPQYRVTPLDYLVLSFPRSRSNHLITSLRAMGFMSRHELLDSDQSGYPAAVYYFRNGTDMSMKQFPLTPEEKQAALSAMFSHGFPDKRNPQLEFFGFKIFPYHFFGRSFGNFIAHSNIVGSYPLKVIHLIRRESFMRALSHLEASTTSVWHLVDSEAARKGALLNFTSENIKTLVFYAMRGCLSNDFYLNDLDQAAQAGIIQVLTVDSKDIDSTSPNIDSTLETVRRFLLRDVDDPRNLAIHNKDTPVNKLLESHSIHHVRDRSSLPLQDRIPEPQRVHRMLTTHLAGLIEKDRRYRYLPSAFHACKMRILQEINTLFVNEFHQIKFF